MNYNIKIGDENIDQLIVIFIIGIMEAIEKELISDEMGEVLLFNPYNFQSLGKISISNDVLDIIKLGMELEDVHQIVPNAYKSTIIEIKKRCIDFLKNVNKLEYPIIRYFD